MEILVVGIRVARATIVEASSSHAVYVSRPDAVARLIVQGTEGAKE